MNKTDSFHNSPSPTNPSETLGQSETRVENTLTEYVAAGIQPWSPQGEAVLSEADTLVKVDPEEGVAIADAIVAGTEQVADSLDTTLMNLIEDGDFPTTA